MSAVEKLSIQGIRSYGQNDKQVRHKTLCKDFPVHLCPSMADGFVDISGDSEISLPAIVIAYVCYCAQVLEFFKPLTLILGKNGSGKTT